MADQVALDHPIWAALTSEHQALAQGGPLALRYPADIASFAAMSEATPRAFDALHTLIPADGRITLFTLDEVAPQPGLQIQLAATAYQMLATSLAPRPASGMEIVALGTADVPEMLRLVELTHPGPFSVRTHTLGNYLGIRVSGELAAMAGERMRLAGYVEISAVCVHPAHRGKGYAQVLILALMHALMEQGVTPILHVFDNNAPAIALYRQLGFEIRQRLHVSRIQLEAPARA